MATGPCIQCEASRAAVKFYRYQSICVDCYNANCAKRYWANHEHALGIHAKSRLARSKERGVYTREYMRRRKAEDPSFRLRVNLRTRLYLALKGKVKVGSAMRELGCSSTFLRQYIESLFQPGMSWDNYGKRPGEWSVDHIVPLAAVDLTDLEQLQKVCHYSNLRPLWHHGPGGNMSKGCRLIVSEGV